jgi:hypothetical protein
MDRDARQADGSGGNPTWVEIGRHLARMYEGYLDSPLPERFLALLARLDTPEQDHSSFGPQDGT